MTDTPTFQVLTVCLGNQCRSPLGERLLARALEGVVATPVLVRSAGIAATAGAAMEPHAAAELRRLGGDDDGFRATPWGPDHEQVDLVLAMTRDLRTAVLRRAPRLMRRAFTLTELAAVVAAHPGQQPLRDRVRLWADHRSAGSSALDVPDPMGGSPELHRAVAEQVAAAVAVVAPALRAAG